MQRLVLPGLWKRFSNWSQSRLLKKEHEKNRILDIERRAQESFDWFDAFEQWSKTGVDSFKRGDDCRNSGD